MPEYPGRKVADKYLVQRIEGASPEQLAALLLEGGQRFVTLILQALKEGDLAGQARYVNRTSDIIFALEEQLNHESGGEVARNLARIYDWWTRELFDAAQKNEPARLQLIFKHMGELRETWEELHRRKTAGTTQPKPTASIGEFSA